MKKMAIIVVLGLLAVTTVAETALANRVVWQGNVSSRGQRITSFPLERGKTYYLEVSGTVYFGRWRVNRRSLVNDACYEFNAKGYPDSLPVFKNNMNIQVCAPYQPNHVYRSAPFRSNGQRITFWICGTDCRDNRGSLNVRIVQVGR